MSVNRYCCKPDTVGFEGEECFHLLRDTEAVCKVNHWSCCGSTSRDSVCTRTSAGPHAMRGYTAASVQCRRCSMCGPVLMIFCIVFELLSLFDTIQCNFLLSCMFIQVI
jgi:hypothetical protein